ncbi:MAG: HAMP domain-containing protein [Methylocystaceae bacterium]|nr:HAMP domain-containing protein [Methylocystaceae bacterium]
MGNGQNEATSSANDALNLDSTIKFGIGKRLIIAFGGVGLLCVLVSFISWNGLSQLNTTQREITKRKVPAITSSLNLASQTSQLVASAPLLSSSKTDEERQGHMDDINAAIKASKQEIATLAPLLQNEKQTKALQNKLNQIPPLLERLNQIVQQNQKMEARKLELAQKLVSLRNITESKLDPMASESNIQLINISDKWRDAMSQAATQAKQGNDEEIDTGELEIAPLKVTGFLKAVLGFKSGANLLIGMLLEGSQSQNEKALEKINHDFLASIASMATPLSTMGQTQDVTELDQLFQELLKMGVKGELNDNVMKLRAQQLVLKAETTELLEKTHQLSASLSTDVKKIVNNMKQEMSTAVNQNEKSADRTSLTLTVVALISIAVVVLVGWLYILRNLVTRLLKLVNNMQEIARGDLTVRVNRNGNDEISLMASALALLRNGLRETDELKKRQEEQQARNEQEKKEHAQKLANDFDSAVGQSLAILSDSVGDIRQKATRMNEISSQTLEETQKVTSASQVMSGDIATVASSTDQLSASITEISSQVANSSQVASEAVTRATNLNNNIEQLKSGSEKIESVIGLINTIAEQTNLLALNATIEASRAGEAGKGFAVVASEVKNLANQTASAIDNISDLINNIQNEISEAVNANGQITSIITEIDQLSSGIAAAVEQQSAATAEISRTVQNTANHVNTISERVNEVSQAIQNNNDMVGEVLHGVSQIDDQSTSLTHEVEHFLEDVRNA